MGGCGGLEESLSTAVDHVHFQGLPITHGQILYSATLLSTLHYPGPFYIESMLYSSHTSYSCCSIFFHYSIGHT